MTPIHTDDTGIIFAPEPVKKIARKLRADIEDILENEETEICNTLNSLVYALLPKRSMRESEQIIAVLFITDAEVWEDVFEFRVLLSHFSIILILPEDDREMAAKAREMQPCIIIDMSTARTDIAHVAEEYKKLREKL